MSADSSSSDDVSVSEDSSITSTIISDAWDEFDGNELSPFLESGAIALLYAQWIMDAASIEDYVIPCRQKIPPKAFLTISQLRHAASRMRFPVIAISYMWLQEDHPDPKGDTLHLLAESLNSFLGRLGDHVRNSGVFWDYASLYQHPRSPQQEQLFQQGLKGLAFLYGHEWVKVLKITDFPSDYPSAYKLSQQDARIVPYHDRGWPFFESCLADLKQSSDDTHQVIRQSLASEITTRNVHSRRVPVVPDKFDSQVEERFFTYGEIDCPMVSGLYRQYFENYFYNITDMLDFSRLSWSDSEVETLMHDVVGQGYARRITELHLSGNHITANACKVVANSILSGNLPCLTEFFIADNPIGDNGAYALAPAMGEMEGLSFSNTGLGDVALMALEESILESRRPRLRRLVIDLNCNIGDNGFRAVISIVQRCRVTMDFVSISSGLSSDNVRKQLKDLCENNNILYQEHECEQPPID